MPTLIRLRSLCQRPAVHIRDLPQLASRCRDAFLHEPRAAASLSGDHGRVVRSSPSGRNRADRLRRARVTGSLLDRRGDRGGCRGGDRRRQPRLPRDRPLGRAAPLRTLGIPAPPHRTRPAQDRAVDGEARRQGGVLRSLRHDPPLHRRVGCRHRWDAVAEVPVLERGRRDLLGDAGRSRLVLRRRGGGGRHPALRDLCGRRDRRCGFGLLGHHAFRQEVAGEPAVVRSLALGLAVLIVAGCGGSSTAATVPRVAPPAVRLPHFTHVVVVVFENHESSSIAGNPDAPTFNALARRYATLTDYTAVTHPSLPNYLALVSGSTQGITSDCTDCAVGARSLADTLGADRKSWKTYAEDLPYPGFTGASSGRYAKKHDPLLYFRDVVDSRVRRRRVVPFTQLTGDLRRH